jgi:membrane-associated phospholipid phosphatase
LGECITTSSAVPPGGLVIGIDVTGGVRVRGPKSVAHYCVCVTVAKVIRWWPLFGLLATLALGWVVGQGPTSVDDAYTGAATALLGNHAFSLLILTKWKLLAPVVAVCTVWAIHRRQWRLAMLVPATPLVAVAFAEALKHVFDRQMLGLSYPSGHTTLVVTVMGMAVLITGARRWAVALAILVSLLAMAGLACTVHYLTDTVGAAVLATAVLAVAARLAAEPSRPVDMSP